NFVAKGTIEEGMLSILAFKRSLSAGILDGGGSEISMGGSRLNRFMKDVENVTGAMGEAEAVAPAEEIMTPTPEADDAALALEKVMRSGIPWDGGGDTATAAAEAPEVRETPGAAGSTGADASADPWAALIQIGAQFVSALAAADADSARSHPWIERDPATGTRSLKLPLPPPETAKKLAAALALAAEALRGMAAGR
ncbi:MAG: hypothetical protein Q8O52_02690, partial [Sulfuritalea sp.]|nr:hypothetical protein [Sulfuritalea sp.]